MGVEGKVRGTGKKVNKEEKEEDKGVTRLPRMKSLTRPIQGMRRTTSQLGSTSRFQG